MSLPSITRRLLKQAEVCTKLNMGKSTFIRRRDQLEREGFPPPVLKGGCGVPTLWDERAIDLWLDAKIRPDLLRGPAPAAAAATYNTASMLKGRAANLTI